jgi:uncharacterized protein YndB with AHSA1/START domain
VIEKSAFLRCSPDRAFVLFTEQASAWWPPALRHTADPSSEITMRPSGWFWEQGANGEAVELGRVTVWEPPRRLVLDFYPGTDSQHPTEVVVTFAAEADGTLVVVVHRPTSRSIPLWDAGAPGYERAWDIVLEALAAAAAVGIT